MRTLGFAFLALVMTSTAYAQDASTPSNSTGNSTSNSTLGNSSTGNLSTPGNASGSSSSSSPTAQIPSQNQPPTGAQIASQIRSDLESAGFKNIRLMPSSFIVRAEDKNGNPVMMVLNPDSMTAVTQVGGSNNSTVGQSQTPGSSGQGMNSDQQTRSNSGQQSLSNSDQSGPETK